MRLLMYGSPCSERCENMIKIFSEIRSVVSRATKFLCILTASAMCILVTLQIVFRGFHVGYGWTDELSRYFMVWMAMLGASLMVADNADVRLEFVIKRLPPKIAGICEAINNILIVIFLVVLSYFGIVKAIDAAGIYATSVKISMMWFYLAVPVGGLLMLIQLICRIVVECGSRKS